MCPGSGLHESKETQSQKSKSPLWGFSKELIGSFWF